MDQAELENYFTYHAPSPEQILRYTQIRNAAKHLAEVILYCCPPSADQTAAIRKVREAVMTANASVACFPILVEIEQVADRITFKSSYMGDHVHSFSISKGELVAVGGVDKHLWNFYDTSARFCGKGQKPVSFQYATRVAVEKCASIFENIPFREDETTI